MSATPFGTSGDKLAAQSPGSDPVAATTAVDSLWTLFGGTMSLLRGLEGEVPNLAEPSAEVCQRLSAKVSDAELFEARADARRRDVGIGLEAGVRGDFTDQTIDEGLPGAYVGVGWELLQSGLVENRRLAELFRVRGEAATVEARLESARDANRCATRAWSLAFEPLLRRLIDDKLATVEVLTAARREAYLSGFGDLEDVLEGEREIQRSETELRSLDMEVASAVTSSTGIDWFPPAIDIDLDAVLGQHAGTQLDTQLLSLQEEEVRLSRATDSRTRLRFYLHYGYRPIDNAADRQGLSGGLVFRMPLFQGNDAGIEAELESVRRRAGRSLDDREDVTRAAYRAFRNQLSTVIRGHYAYLENFERVRRSAAVRTVEADRADLVRGMNDILGLHGSALDRALSLRELYAAATEVFAAAGRPFDPSFITPVDLPDTGYRSRVGDRSVYVWSDAFNRYANDFLLELARAKGFERIVLSAGRTVSESKLSRFRTAADEAGFSLELALSTNSWLRPEMRGGVAERIAELDLSGVDLHLDVEPQMLEDFQERSDSLLAAYVDVVARAREAIGPDAKLSISVPVWWPQAVYEQLSPLVDRVYLMAYGASDPQTVAERVGPVAESIEVDKIVLAIRAEDFSTEWDMDVVFAHVAESTGIARGAVHDLAGFITMLEGR